MTGAGLHADSGEVNDGAAVLADETRQKGSVEDVYIGGGAPTYQVSDGTAVVQVGEPDEVRHLDPLEPAALGSPDE